MCREILRAPAAAYSHDMSAIDSACKPLQSMSVQLTDAAATARAGAAFAPMLAGGMVVTLSGDVGAGKTTLVRGALRALGVAGPIKSPSYALVEHYPLSSIYFY